MIEVYAVKPPRGRVVHLHVPGYQPGSKDRPLKDRSGMCGIGIWPNGVPRLERELVPLVDALQWTSLAPCETDPRPTWVWCRPCIGHLVVHAGMEGVVLASLVDVLGGGGSATTMAARRRLPQVNA